MGVKDGELRGAIKGKSMPERAFLTETWDDDWFHGLSRDQRYLFIYLWTNNRCTQAGAYHINLATMAFETKIPQEELPELLKSLAPKVGWYPEQNYVWVKNFLKWQAKSPKFLVAAAKCLKGIKNNGLVKEIINYNLKQHSISIPYEESIDRVSVGYRYPTDTSLTPIPFNTGTGKGGGDGGEKGVVRGAANRTKTRRTVPRSESEIEESLCEGDREVISVWRSVKGFNLPVSAAAELVTKLRKEFPDVDILAESKAWAARKLSEPLTRKSRPSGQIWNFMEKRRKWDKEKRGEHEQREIQQRADAHRKDPLQAFRDAGGTVILSGEEAEAGNEDGAV